MQITPLRRLGWLPVALLLTLTPAVGDPPSPPLPPQPTLTLTQGMQGTFNADWQGVAGRTYFTQFSLDLTTWIYAPFIDFGDGEHRRGLESDSQKLFLRLVCYDFPGINSLEDAMNADFDNDGLTNLFEIMNGLDPLNPETHGTPDALADPDQDGLGNLSEQTHGRNPLAKDNPAVQLTATVGY